MFKFYYLLVLEISEQIIIGVKLLEVKCSNLLFNIIHKNEF